VDINVGDKYRSLAASPLWNIIEVRAVVDGDRIITRKQLRSGLSLSEYLPEWHYKIYHRDEFELLVGHGIFEKERDGG